MRPILYGLITFFGSGVLWWLFSVSAGLEMFAKGSSSQMALVYLFGIIFLFSLPVTVIAEIVRWARGRRRR
jgi:hypothetical protein